MVDNFSKVSMAANKSSSEKEKEAWSVSVMQLYLQCCCFPVALLHRQWQWKACFVTPLKMPSSGAASGLNLLLAPLHKL